MCPCAFCGGDTTQLFSGHAVRRMLCPHMFPSLANPSLLNTEPPPFPLFAAVPGVMCEIAPPIKFGWQVLKSQPLTLMRNLLRLRSIHRRSPSRTSSCRFFSLVAICAKISVGLLLKLVFIEMRSFIRSAHCSFRSNLIILIPVHQQWLAQIEQHRKSDPRDDVCEVLDAAAAVPCPPSTAWRVTFLGTGGALPSKHRNVSGILLSYKCCSSCTSDVEFEAPSQGACGT
jgi:hypothetical protein